MSYRYKKDEKPTLYFLGISALVCFLLASSVIPFLAAAKASPTPDLLLCFVCILPFFTDTKKSAFFAVALGFLSDLFITSAVCLSPIVYLASVYISARFHTYFAKTGSLSLAISALPSIVMKLLVNAVAVLLTVDGAKMSSMSFGRGVLTVIITFASAMILAFIMRAVYKKLKI